MAEKEATLYILDVGSSMSQPHHGRTQSDLDYAMIYIWDKITTTMALDRKTTFQGMVLFKTDETANELAESGDENFRNISVIQELGTILMVDLRRLNGLIKASGTEEGDAVSALVLGIQMIAQKCKKLKYKRKIVMVCSGRGSVDLEEQEEAIVGKLKEDGIELVILGVDFDDPDVGIKEEGKGPEKAFNEAKLKSLAEKSGGIFGSVEQAITELGEPRLKITRSIASFKGQLTLGDPTDKNGDTMFIDVERHPRIMVRRPPAASSYAVRASGDKEVPIERDIVFGDQTGDGEGDIGRLTTLSNTRRYYVDDPAKPEVKMEVEFDDLAKGYEYGSTAVPISDSDWQMLRFETKPGLEILGFIPCENFERQMEMSTTNVIVHQKGNAKAAMALSSFIHALWELESYAIARFVQKADKDPLLVLLSPNIEGEFECLVEAQLPFAEDVRNYRFAPLDKVFTISGKEVKEHRFLPKKDLQDAMSEYVDSMDISKYTKDEDGNDIDFARMEDTFSPTLHRIDQAIRWRAAHPTEPIPPAHEVLTKYSRPPEDLLEQAKPKLAKLIAAADVKEVPPRVKGRKGRKADHTATPLSGLDVDALLSGGLPHREKPNITTTSISTDPPNDTTTSTHPASISRTPSTASTTSNNDTSNPNPNSQTSETTISIRAPSAIPDFRNVLEYSPHPDRLNIATAQFGTIIEKHARESFGDRLYGTVIEEMKAFRDEMEALDAAQIWNKWVRGFKEKLLGGQLGGERGELWYQIRGEGIGVGLIAGVERREDEGDEDEDAKRREEGNKEGGKVTEEEARGFWRGR